MINVKYPRKGFVVEEVIEGCKTEGCNAEKFVVNSWEHYGEDTFNDLTEGCKRGEHSASYGDIEGACPKCRKPVIYKNYFVVTSDASDIKTAEDAVAFAVNVLQAPFPEGEALIATSVDNAYRYAAGILKAPFPLGEAVISTDAEYSYSYATQVLKAPFPLGEAAIAKYAEHSYYYATQVLQAPFPLGEAAIATNEYYFKKYKKLFPESQATPEPQEPDSMNIVSGFYLKEKSSMSDKQKRRHVIKSTFLTLVYTLEDMIELDRQGGTYHFVGSLFQADNILTSIHNLMETFPNLTRDLATETYPKVKSYMDEYSKYRKEKYEKEKPNV